MSTTKKLRALISISLAAMLTFTLTACAGGYGSDSNPKTSDYLYSKFSNGEFVDPYETGKGDVGVTMESMIQLSAVGYDKSKFTKAIAWLVKNEDLIKSPGLQGEFIFASHALDFSDDAIVAKKLKQLKSSITAKGVVKETNNFSYCWVILGLMAAGEKELANRVALQLATQNESSGGYKYIYGDSKSEEAADVTAFVVQAIKSTVNTGNESDEATKMLIAGRAKVWINRNKQDGNYWKAFGAYDISGTAYAAMAYRTLEQDSSPYSDYLKTKINKKSNGLIASWTEPDADIFSTSQAILALNNLNFIDILKNKVK